MDVEQLPDQPAAPETRLPYDVEFVKHVKDFCTTILQKLPELHGIAIVPIWENQPENMPAGSLHLRNAQPPYIPSLLALLKRLSVFGVDIHKDLVNQFGMYERYAAHLYEEVAAHREELNKLGTDNPATNDQ